MHYKLTKKLTEKIFDFLDTGKELIEELSSSRDLKSKLYCPDLYAMRKEAELRYGKKSTTNSFTSLLRKKYLKYNKKYKKYFLTSKGINKFLEYRIRKKIEQKTKLEDKYLVLIFDIPEDQRAKRDFLRNKIRQLGFEMIQWSVWITQADVLKELKTYIKLNNLDQYIRFFVAEKV